jgi:serine/threonine protein phosphatase PrpC
LDISKTKYFEIAFTEEIAFQKVNRDFHGIYTGNFGKLYIVARGIGREGSEVISHLSVISIKNFFDKMPKKYNTQIALRQAFKVATKEVLSHITKHNWLSSCSASIGLILINSTGVYAAHAGDCRILLIHNRKVKCLTVDHFSVKEISGIIKHEGSLKVPIISNTIGLSHVEPEIISDIKLVEGDILLILTKGVYQRVTRFQMLRAFSENKLESAVDTLWEQAKTKKSSDFFTMIAIQVYALVDKKLEKQVIVAEKAAFTRQLSFLLGSLILLFFTIFPLLRL